MPANWAAPVSRDQSFGLAFLVLAINAGAGFARQSLADMGWLGAAFDLFGLSAILWCAAGAALALLFSARRVMAPRPIDHLDVLALGLATTALIPVPAISAAALTALAAFAAFRSPAASPLRRASLIFLSITTSLLWGRIALAMASGPLLGLEAALTGWVAGSQGTGNLVQFSNGAGMFVVAPGCSSLQGLSLAIVLWVTVTQFQDLRIDARALLALLAALVGVVVSNTLRLGAIARFPEHFDYLHTGFGATMFGWLALVLIVTALLIGFHDDFAARR